MNQRQMLEELKNFDTPSITNVVATYPESPLCLGLYNPWTENWYTDTSIRCMYPELGRRVGYAVTCVYGLPDPNYSRLSFMDVLEAMEASPQPTVLVIEQKFPSRDRGQGGLGRRQHGLGDEGAGLRRLVVERSLARSGRNPRNGLPVYVEWRNGRPWRDGGACCQCAGRGRRHGCRAGRADSHGRKRRLQISRPISWKRC